MSPLAAVVEYPEDAIASMSADGIIANAGMPQMHGNVMDEWRTLTCPDLKVLFTSGHTDEAIANHDEPAAAMAFLRKPYAVAQLACKVRAMLDQ